MAAEQDNKAQLVTADSFPVLEGVTPTVGDESGVIIPVSSPHRISSK